MSALHFTEEDFNKTVLEDKKPAVVDFGAVWCGPCQMMAPLYEDLADEMDGKLTVGLVEVDECPGLIMRYMTMTVPTVIFFKDGEEQGRHVGLISYEDLKKAAESLL